VRFSIRLKNGALTNKLAAFSYRKWEFRHVGVAFDRTDVLVPHIQIQKNSNQVFRILPLEEWISNKIRFFPVSDKPVAQRYTENFSFVYILQQTKIRSSTKITYQISSQYQLRAFINELAFLRKKTPIRFNIITYQNQLQGIETYDLLERFKNNFKGNLFIHSDFKHFKYNVNKNLPELTVHNFENCVQAFENIFIYGNIRKFSSNLDSFIQRSSQDYDSRFKVLSDERELRNLLEGRSFFNKEKRNLLFIEINNLNHKLGRLFSNLTNQDSLIVIFLSFDYSYSQLVKEYVLPLSDAFPVNISLGNSAFSWSGESQPLMLELSPHGTTRCDSNFTLTVENNLFREQSFRNINGEILVNKNFIYNTNISDNDILKKFL
jgi:hypothetical protein